VVFGIRAGRAMREAKKRTNRLAGNSLPQREVSGVRAGRTIFHAEKGTGAFMEQNPIREINAPLPASEVRRIAWEKCGIVRSAEGLREAAAHLEALAPESPEERNMRLVALLIARCALARQESRGAHFRIDYPQASEAFARHSVVAKHADVIFR
jgi:L-aspartate oxidase